MPDPAVAKFKIAGQIAVWRYRCSRSLPGWHMSCDNVAGNGLLQLCDLMQTAQYSSRKRIPINPNPQLTVAPGGVQHPILAKSFEIRYAGKFAPDHWKLSESDGLVILALGSAMLPTFRTGITDILKGQGDYSMGENPKLWFWWMVNK